MEGHTPVSAASGVRLGDEVYFLWLASGDAPADGEDPQYTLTVVNVHQHRAWQCRFEHRDVDVLVMDKGASLDPPAMCAALTAAVTTPSRCALLFSGEDNRSLCVTATLLLQLQSLHQACEVPVQLPPSGDRMRPQTGAAYTALCQAFLQGQLDGHSRLSARVGESEAAAAALRAEVAQCREQVAWSRAIASEMTACGDGLNKRDKKRLRALSGALQLRAPDELAGPMHRPPLPQAAADGNQDELKRLKALTGLTGSALPDALGSSPLSASAGGSLPPSRLGSRHGSTSTTPAKRKDEEAAGPSQAMLRAHLAAFARRFDDAVADAAGGGTSGASKGAAAAAAPAPASAADDAGDAAGGQGAAPESDEADELAVAPVRRILRRGGKAAGVGSRLAKPSATKLA